MAFSSGWLVAATTRTSTRIGVWPPTRSNGWPSSTRSSFACVPTFISPISSRKIVPWWADSNLPIFFSVAPVKEPFSWPNSSLSSSVSVKAAQLRQTNGPSLRGLE